MKNLIERIGESVKDRIAEAKLSPLEDEIRKYILREFARTSKAPTPAEIMGSLSVSSIDVVNKTIEILEKADLLLRRDGIIISAYPFSTEETLHKVIFEDGHEVNALCATDAAGIHFMLNEDITIISKCPECGRKMRIVVKDGQVGFCDPEGIIEFVSVRERCGYTAETLCPFINFFCSDKHLEKWRDENPEFRDGEIYSLSEVLKHGKFIFQDFLK